MLTTLILTTALSLAPYEPLADHATNEQIDAWCADMIDAGHLTDSVVYICFDDEGNEQ